MEAKHWQEQGSFVAICGHQHFVYDSESDKPALLILHGYPTCSYDYHKVIPMLEKNYRVVVHDHLGFGFSDKPLNYSYSLMEQADQALQLWHQLGIEQAVILAHDYGTSVATELLARMNRFNNIGLKVIAMVLCNGSMHIEMSKLRLMQKLLLNSIIGPWVAKLSNKRIFAKNIRNVYFNSSLISDEEIDALWTMLSHNEGRKALSKTTQYIKQRHVYWHRWIGALQSTELPIKIIWAKNDPVAVIAMAETLKNEIKNSELTVLNDSGHFPMLENPKVWTEAVLKALN
jgi:pimeloyl-ACP methyl ester carboxylesterase